MSENIMLQLRFMGDCYIMGLVIMTVYDLMEWFRRKVTHGKAEVLAEDVIFWLFLILYVFITLRTKNDGKWDYMVFLAATAGMLTKMALTWILNKVKILLCKQK